MTGGRPRPVNPVKTTTTTTKLTPTYLKVNDGVVSLQEISSSPVLFSEGSTRFDIGQGGAGTCWFLSTVANISEHKELLNQVGISTSIPAAAAASGISSPELSVSIGIELQAKVYDILSAWRKDAGKRGLNCE